MKMRKGITPVISVVLLLMITVALVGFAFVWFQGIWQNVADTTGTGITTQVDIMNTRVAIENINSVTNKITIRNTGSVNVATNSLSFYINNEPVVCDWTIGGTETDPGQISPATSATCRTPLYDVGPPLVADSIPADAESTVKVVSLANTDISVVTTTIAP